MPDLDWIHAMPHGAFVVDSDDVIRAWNPTMDLWTRVDSSEAIGRSVFEIVPELDRDHHRARLQMVLANGLPMSVSPNLHGPILPLREQGGHDMAVNITVTRLKSATGPMLLFTVQNVTDLVERALRYQALHREAKAASRAKSEFLASISHEIRTPLNGILGYAGMLLEDELPEDLREPIQSINDAGDHLLELLTDVLEFSRLESTAVRLTPEPGSIRKVARGVIGVFEAQARSKRLDLRVFLAEDVIDERSFDARRVRQVLLNLVGNAIKFTDRGFVELTTTVGHDVDHVRFTVRDSGIGIAPEDLERLFEPFERAETSRVRAEAGTGLGLAICHRMAGLLGPGLNATSHPGAGSSFEFEVHAPFALVEGTTEVETEAVGIDLRGLRVLFVDDAEVNLELGLRMLEREGCFAQAARNGEQAITLATNNEFDAIVMDCRMPVMDGYTATRALRELGIDVPIIAVTANAMPGDREACEAAGMNDYLAKPITPVKLRQTLQRWVRSAWPA